jgi:hypothetical protein
MIRQMEIRFRKELADLCSLTYLSNDLHQLVAGSRLPEEGRNIEAEQFGCLAVKSNNRVLV